MQSAAPTVQRGARGVAPRGCGPQPPKVIEIKKRELYKRKTLTTPSRKTAGRTKLALNFQWMSVSKESSVKVIRVYNSRFQNFDTTEGCRLRSPKSWGHAPRPDPSWSGGQRPRVCSRSPWGSATRSTTRILSTYFITGWLTRRLGVMGGVEASKPCVRFEDMVGTHRARANQYLVALFPI